MKKFFAAAALVFFTCAGLQAAPALGVTWRAPPNKKDNATGGQAKSPGVKILSVAPGSNAEELGLKVGQFVVSVNGKPVLTGQEATAAVAAAKGKLTLSVSSTPYGKQTII